MRRDSHFLEDIRGAAERVVEFTTGMRLSDFVADKKTQAAVERQLTIMGEAASRISETYRAEHADIPWKKLIQLRNFYIHGYDRLQAEQVWGTATRLAPRVAQLAAAVLSAGTGDAG